MSGGGGGKGKKHQEEEHVNHERWMVTYADMITLLMVLFIVMFAMSSVDSQKFQELKKSLAGAFSGSDHITVFGAGGAGSANGGINPDPVDLKSEASGSGSTQDLSSKAAQEAVQQADREKAAKNLKAAEAEVQHLKELGEQMAKQLQDQGLGGTAQFRVDDRGLVVTVVTTSVVFAGDRAELLPDGQRIVDALAPVLKSVGNRVEVDGHTNQLPVATVNYPSSWELSTARASSVVRYLIERDGLASDRLTAVGYADTRPLYDPADPRSVTGNRRVEVVVLSDQPTEVRTLLPAAAAG
ncbi:OmpA family protein [Actinosynnema pretiosum subsp. pretiosum]|uniref:OmpA family protein n=1 Tax=Actinosynnema pretiosum subsp. pretiosum TaxID=103721 RepID=A0AA45LAI7_9PSEU|nr:Flagellar motor rotation protein MotB [Actinosynnema pretiosum subsp. pretiosum]QUF06053.1 OmpA family protein [Actinosynnema pretiosum subsp. pretiosum]